MPFRCPPHIRQKANGKGHELIHLPPGPAAGRHKGLEVFVHQSPGTRKQLHGGIPWRSRNQRNGELTDSCSFPAQDSDSKHPSWATAGTDRLLLSNSCRTT